MLFSFVATSWRKAVSLPTGMGQTIPEDAWIPYLTINFTLTKQGSDFKKTGTLAAVAADDGPHYANNVAMDGPGTYDLTYWGASTLAP